ncbi:MAG TPA: helix-turn-helix transcriptional regulator [Gemmatimonadales bacterium]|nr:helix-turn-helix transcriptional regulator [Gemmatimonadales bacterium]
MSTDPAADALLPLHPQTFHILLALGRGDQHGYAILRAVEERTEGAVKLSAGALYRTIHRLLEQGLITEPRNPTGPTDDQRRRYYRLTPFGRTVALAETRRLRELVQLARHSGLVPDTP